MYMSPELIDSRHGLRGYDGMKVDVWACGVLLIAMLLGTFPFDHTKHPDPNTHEAQLEVWCELLLNCGFFSKTIPEVLTIAWRWPGDSLSYQTPDIESSGGSY